ncbi:uncharacterized protein APUU_71092S [Aspergillus puulaauensis]|uniref:F-box domain-containing protein n=1 Tax=Aspergillus puulaauensis TaxID=1220207 RepID=A0A7R7XXY4_9EURO|nr:uncharacterized protein APUU_71092S [Aspergillus puulaauensis]BCS29522.1 hypothetical protein APUU_71092S [Aspergillus puulaauensis]
MQGLSSLPPEIILHVTDFLDYEYEINALSRANRHFHRLLTAELYKATVHRANAAQGSRNSNALLWVAVRGVEQTFPKLLAAGSRLDSVLLPVAAAYGQDAIVKLLCEHRHGADAEVDLNQYLDWRDRLDLLGAVEREIIGTPLTLAAQYGHESVIQPLLSYGADIDSRGLEGRTALAVAAESGFLSICKVLLSHGADVEAVGYNHATPLHLASRAGHTEIVRALLEKHADVDHQDRFRHSTLAVAAAGGCVETVQCLLDYEALPNMQMLMACARYQRAETLKLLIRHFDYPRSAQNQAELTTVACAAAACGLSDLLAEVIGLDWEVNSVPVRGYLERGDAFDRYWTPLAYASSFGYLDIVRMLLSHGANVNGMRYRAYLPDRDAPASPLSCAVKGGWTDIVTLLLERGANISFAMANARDNKILCDAVAYEPILKALLDRGALECTPFSPTLEYLAAEAVRAGNAKSVRMLIDGRVDIWKNGFQLEEGRGSANVLAEAKGAVLDVLVQAGCLPRAGEETEIITTCSAVTAANIPLLQHLISRGLDISPRSPELRYQLLRRVVTNHYVERAEISLDFLLGEGLEINTLDKDGQTLLLSTLHHQATYFRDGTIGLLVDRGANPCFQDTQGNCPLVAAVHNEAASSDTSISLLRGIEAQKIPFEVFAPQVLKAISAAEECGNRDDRLRILRRFYWRRRYPV